MTAYNLSSIQLPKLTGWGLRLFVAALKNFVIRPLILKPLTRRAGLLKFRRLKIEERPTYCPLDFSATKSATLAKKIPQISFLEAIDDGNRLISPFRSIRDYAKAYRMETITPQEVAMKVLAAVAASDSDETPMRAFIACSHEDVMAQAQAATQRIRAGRPLSVLDGVPVSIKDELDQVPYPTTVGTSFMGRQPTRKDATVVARLRQAGALLIGKNNMHEIGINPNGLNVHYGTVRNPYHLAHDSGGSSSGTAAAVASGICPVAIGADGGGSIRIPAALCGVIGLKPTFGRISEHGAAPLCWSLAHLGPIGATTEDVALTYALIAGPDLKDPWSQYQPEIVLDNWNNPDLGGIILGVYPAWLSHAAASVVSACKEMLENLRKCGAQIREIEIAELDEMRISHGVTILSEITANMQNYRENYQELGPSVQISLELGRELTSSDYILAQRMRTRSIAIFRKAFEKVDVIITPATAMTAPPIPAGGLRWGWSDLSATTELMRFSFPGNFAGLPAISFPVGYDQQGLPIGMQALGRPWEEHILMQVAFVAEQALERKLPRFFFKILD